MSGATPCYICSSPMTDVSLDPRDMKTKPCSHCLSIIAECANEQEDDDFIAYIEDDEFAYQQEYREVKDYYEG